MPQEGQNTQTPATTPATTPASTPATTDSKFADLGKGWDTPFAKVDDKYNLAGALLVGGGSGLITWFLSRMFGLKGDVSLGASIIAGLAGAHGALSTQQGNGFLSLDYLRELMDWNRVNGTGDKNQGDGNEDAETSSTQDDMKAQQDLRRKEMLALSNRIKEVKEAGGDPKQLEEDYLKALEKYTFEGRGIDDFSLEEWDKGIPVQLLAKNQFDNFTGNEAISKDENGNPDIQQAWTAMENSGHPLIQLINIRKGDKEMSLLRDNKMDENMYKNMAELSAQQENADWLASTNSSQSNADTPFTQGARSTKVEGPSEEEIRDQQARMFFIQKQQEAEQMGRDIRKNRAAQEMLSRSREKLKGQAADKMLARANTLVETIPGNTSSTHGGGGALSNVPPYNPNIPGMYNPPPTPVSKPVAPTPVPGPGTRQNPQSPWPIRQNPISKPVQPPKAGIYPPNNEFGIPGALDLIQ